MGTRVGGCSESRCSIQIDTVTRLRIKLYISRSISPSYGISRLRNRRDNEFLATYGDLYPLPGANTHV